MFEIGGSLREARLKRNLTPADVQKAIRIRDRYLQALEEERWELLPGDAYVKGFLRTYADYLGLDGNLYVEEYNSRFARPDEPQLVPERFARSGTPFGGVGFLRPLIVVAVIVAIVAGLAAWQLSSSSDDKQGTPPTTSVATTTTTSHHTTTTEEAQATSTSLRALPTTAVVVASRGNSWLWVRSGGANGPTVYQGTLLQGKTLPVNLKNGPVWIRIGDPPSIDVRLGGKLVRGLPTQVGNVAPDPPRDPAGLSLDGGDVDVDRGHVAPQLFEPVVLARVGREDVEDDVEVVRDDPGALAHPVDAPGEQPLVLLQAACAPRPRSRRSAAGCGRSR